MQLFHISIISLLIGFSLPNLSTSRIIVEEKDINNYLTVDSNPTEEKLNLEISFWEEKLVRNPHQYPYKLKLAGLQNQLFKINGQVSHLNLATTLLEKAAQETNNLNSSILRTLGRNYISQHRFRDAFTVLSKAEFIGEKLMESQKMLFDVHMELGNYALAGCYLAEISKVADFDYFIRMAKWQDYLGELDHAIHFMELARDQAERLNNEDLIIWSYTNLGDFYGHANRIQEAYEMYKLSLEIDPGNIYALKQIAWIAYSYEKKPDKALQILESIERRYYAPELRLSKSEINDFQGNTTSSKRLKAEFMHEVGFQKYGRMYNTYLIELLIENKEFEKAIALAENEVNQRSTPETNGLLAWSYYHSGDSEKAYDILKDKVVGHTFEPIPLYFSSEVYKEIGEIAFVEKTKKDLLESLYELGPGFVKKINNL